MYSILKKIFIGRFSLRCSNIEIISQWREALDSRVYVCIIYKGCIWIITDKMVSNSCMSPSGCDEQQ